MNNHMLKLKVGTEKIVALCHEFTDAVIGETLCTGVDAYPVDGKVVLFEGPSFEGRGYSLCPDSDKVYVQRHFNGQSQWDACWVVVSPEFVNRIKMESCTGSMLTAVNIGQGNWEVRVTPGCSYARFLEGN